MLGLFIFSQGQCSFFFIFTVKFCSRTERARPAYARPMNPGLTESLYHGMTLLRLLEPFILRPNQPWCRGSGRGGCRAPQGADRQANAESATAHSATSPLLFGAAGSQELPEEFWLSGEPKGSFSQQSHTSRYMLLECFWSSAGNKPTPHKPAACVGRAAVHATSEGTEGLASHV